MPMIASGLRHGAETAVRPREHGNRRTCAGDTDRARFSFVDLTGTLADEPRGYT